MKHRFIRGGKRREAHGGRVGGSNKAEAAPQPLESLLVRVELQKKPRCIPCFGDMDGALVVAKLEAGKNEASSYLPGRASGWDEDLNKAKWEEILAMLH